MKKYKVRITGLGIEATAIIPFEIEPTIDQLHSKIIEYLNHNLFKVVENSFIRLEHWTSTKKNKVLKYDIFYEEIKNESQPAT